MPARQLSTMVYYVRIPNGEKPVDYQEDCLISVKELEENGGAAYAIAKIKARTKPTTLELLQLFFKDEDGNIVLVREKWEAGCVSLALEDSDLTQSHEEFDKWYHAIIEVSAEKGKIKSDLKFKVIECPVEHSN